MMKKISLILFSLFISANFLCAQRNVIEKVEPPFWWAGMKDNNLQLLVYGKSIGNSSVNVKSDIVDFKSAQQVENKNYLFINLEVNKQGKVGNVPIEFTLNGKSFTYDYEIKKRRPNAEVKPKMDQSDVIYLITPDRFVNGDPSNDNVKGCPDKHDRKAEYGRHGGDIQGMINSIPYIKELGVSAVWPMPLLENNQEMASYHGYAISNFYETDKRYGTNELFKELVDKLHENGLKMVQDQVFNHCGSAYWWMDDLPMKDWINDPKEYGQSNFNNVVTSDPHASQYDYNKHYKGYFHTSMPDLNLNNPFFANYMMQNSIWWLEYANIDAIRVDTYPYVDKHFMSKWRKRIDMEYPGIFVVAEVWVSEVAYEAYWNHSTSNYDGYVSNVESVTDFPVYYSMLDAFKKGGDIGKLYSCLSKDFLYGKPEMNVVFFDNHDLSRTFGELGQDYEAYKQAATFILTTRGIPQWYYGSEILMKAQGSHGYIREDMPGGWEGDERNVFTGKNMTKEEMEALNFIKKLLAWRKTSNAIKDGKLVHFIPNDNVYVYFRVSDKEKVMVILNNGDKKDLKLDIYQEILGGHQSGKDIISGEKFDLTKPVSIKGKSSYIISIN